MGKLTGRTAYKRGRAFEYKIQNHFRKLGYLVMRSPQSKGPFDLIVLGKSVVLLVQCKGGGSLGPVAWNELYNLADVCSGHAILATRPKRGSIEFHKLTDFKSEKTRREQPMERVAFTFNV